MFQYSLKIFLFLFLYISSVNAQTIDITTSDENILNKVEVYIDDKNLDFKEIQISAHFKPNHQKYINLGFVKHKIFWIKLTLQNNSSLPVSKILHIKNPLLEEVLLFNENAVIDKSGMLHVKRLQNTIEPSFQISLDTNQTNTYYVKIKNDTTALRFGLYLKNRDTFLHQDYIQQITIIFFLGIIVSLMLYNILLYIYIKEKSYFHYSAYLAVLIFQQITYLGVTPLLFPHWFVTIDNLSVLFKINILVVMAAIFAKSFLQTIRYRVIHKIYSAIILIALVEIPLFGTPWFYYPEVGVITGLFFILFNMFAGVKIYLDGYKQARLFIAGWSVLILAFILIIFDALGFISVMQDIPNILLYATTAEALLLSLAFTDKYSIVVKQKEDVDNLLVQSLQTQQELIQNEIDKQTKELSQALKNEKVLLKELHHRIKNNLQLILSIIRMQKDKNSLPEVKVQLKDLEKRISAISQTHEILYLKNDLQHIDMYEYTFELSEYILQSYNHQKITCNIDIKNIFLPLKDISYIGLIINEIVTNSLKHANVENLIINISMKKNENDYILKIKDNGKSYTPNLDTKNKLGSIIIKTLVENQLEGEMRIETEKGLSYMIIFKL